MPHLVCNRFMAQEIMSLHYIEAGTSVDVALALGDGVRYRLNRVDQRLQEGALWTRSTGSLRLSGIKRRN